MPSASLSLGVRIGFPLAFGWDTLTASDVTLYSTGNIVLFRLEYSLYSAWNL